jgi:microcompartment protein CcmL/EutN
VSAAAKTPEVMSEVNGTLLRNDHNPVLRDDVELRPSIGLLELCTVPSGILVADAVLWQANVELLFASPVQPGKYVMLFTGSVEDVHSGLERGREVAGSDLVDRLFLAQAHAQIPRALRRRGGVIEGRLDAVGVLETTTVASAILAADLAVKTATVDLLDLRIANGLGGKSFFTLTGNVADVRASIQAAARQSGASGTLAREVVLPQPHPDLARHL